MDTRRGAQGELIAPGKQPGDPIIVKMHLDWLTLKFSGQDAELERPFLDYYSFRSLNYTRFALVAATLMIAIFGILDHYLLPNHTRLLWGIRFGVICPATLLVVAFTYSKRLVRLIPFFQVFLLLLTAVGFTVMIMFSPMPVNYLYYTGLIAVLTYGYTFLRLRFIWSTLAGWLIVFIYIALAASKAEIPIPIFISNIFFLVTSNVIGMMASYSIEYYARNDFFLMNKMKATQDEMAHLNLVLDTRVRERTADLVTNNLQLTSEIEERKAAEAALRESEMTNRALIQAIPDLVFTNRRDGEYLAVHVADPTLLYAPPEAFLHRNIQEVLPQPLADQIMAAIAKALASNTVQELNYSLRVEEGDKAFEARVVPSTADTVITMVRDVTERTRAREQQAQLQAQLQQSQKMDSLGTLASGLAHDMNNVLGAILGLASANLEVAPADSPTRRAFEIITKAATRGGETVKRLLSFARQSPAEDRELDVNAILRDEIRILERTTPANLRFEMDLADRLRCARGDASALSHAFMNLCINAVDAMPEGGTLTLRSRDLEGDWIEVRIEDTGTGMSKDVLERALEPFFTTKMTGKGTGLGLAMVYSTVKAHRGDIEIHSEPGLGTQVSVRLPVCPSDSRAMEPGPGPNPGQSTRSLKVLLVDDDELIQSSMQTILRTLGCEVTGVLNGEAALAALQEGLLPEVVILDMNMPGLGGSGTLPRLRALLPQVPVLLSTGRVDQSAVNLAEAHPHVSLLPKPFNVRDLQQRLEPIRRG
jgi:signal transduction histidine kinase/CheY-like chemotaxis protein